ncbi:MAG TPA: methyl-accepting chemotaxis protein [Anaerovoracaceae bacterium]|nr:methyl-accepting chemotaxis protein [Anaerovoracaceae bacterium]
MQKKIERKGTIGTKIIILLILSIIISSLSIGIFSYLNYKDNSLKINGEKALSVAQSIASGIDGDKFDQYQNTGVTDGYYNQIKDMMSEIKQRNDLTYVYSLVDSGSDFKYIVSGYAENDDQTTWGYLGYTDPKDIFSEEASLVLADGTGRYTKPQDYGEGYGILVSGFAPIFNSRSDIVGIVGVDLSVSETIADVNKIIPVIALMILLTSLILFALSYLYVNRSISKPIREIAEQSKLLQIGDTDVHVPDRYLRRNDEIGLLGRGFVELASNIKEQAMLGEEIAAGNLSVDVTPRSSKDVMAISMNSVIHTLRELVKEAEHLSVSTIEGNLENRGNSELFEGGYKEIIDGFNRSLDAVIGPLQLTAEYIERISRGDIPEPAEYDAKGDYGKIRDSFNLCIASINRLIADTNMLSHSALAGDFETRADAGLHEGDFRRIIEGVNGTLDTIVDKVFWYEQLLDAVPFPISVTDLDMNWTFINKPVESMLNVKRGDILGKPCSNWNANICKTENCGVECLKRGQGKTLFGQNGMNFQVDAAYINNAKGEKIGHIEVVQDITASVRRSNYQKIEVERLSRNLSLLSEGNLELDFNVAEADTYTTLDRENFITINNNLKSAKDSINALINDAAFLTRAAIEGNLQTRADAEKSKGAWKVLVSGMNNILEEIAKPVKDVTAVMNQISDGNLSVTVSGSYHGDFNELSRAVNNTASWLGAVVGEISGIIQEIAGENLDLVHVKEYRGDFKVISDSLNIIIESLNGILGNISMAADQVTMGSKQVSEGSQALSQGTTEQASSIEELTASVNEIAAKTRENASSAGKANNITLDVKENAEQGNAHMKQMLDAMEEINASSNNISRIIKVIDDIAFQTNILALNAAVEAARAGQHGKGFAVVAEEVRTLAARSAEAAKETTELIQGSISKASGGTEIAQKTAAALDQIVGGVSKTVDLISEIARSSNEQATGIAQINTGLNQVSQVVQTSAATAEESAASSEELSSQAIMLKEMVGKFKLRKMQSSGDGTIRLLEDRKPKSASSPHIALGDHGFGKY